jgi:hypothetical protein
MKNSGKKILRTGLALVLLATITTAFFSFTGKHTAQARMLDCGNVTNQQVIDYLTPHGYTVSSVNAIAGSCDKRCDTQNCYDTKVLITNGRIVGYEDMPNGCTPE